jgi:protein-S-isoprenylcysteine O-methyltransferase Ste14
MEGDKKQLRSKAIKMQLVIFSVMALLFFGAAGTLRYWQAWLWLLELMVMMSLTSVYLFKYDLKLMARRTNLREREKQSKVQSLLNLYILGFILPGFDKRFGWSSVPIPLTVVSQFFVIAGLILIFTVFKTNSYAATTVKVEKSQSVISSGPYAIVRHPMYSGMLLILLCSPTALGSFVALAMLIFSVPSMVLRIKNEEKLLHSALEGYIW